MSKERDDRAQEISDLLQQFKDRRLVRFTTVWKEDMIAGPTRADNEQGVILHFRDDATGDVKCLGFTYTIDQSGNVTGVKIGETGAPPEPPGFPPDMAG